MAAARSSLMSMSPVAREPSESEDAVVPDDEDQHSAPPRPSGPSRCSSPGSRQLGAPWKAGRPTDTPASASDCIADGLPFEAANTRSPSGGAAAYEQRVSLKPTTNEELMSKITAFDNQREEEKRRMYRAILWVVTRLFILGTFGSAAGVLLGFLLPGEIIIYESVRVTGFFIIVLGVVMGSSCPFDLLDINEMGKRQWKAMTGMFTAFLLIAVLQIRLFPHLDSLKVIASVGGGIATWPRSPTWWPYCTSFVAFYFMANAASWGCIWLFPERNDLPEMPTWGYYLNSAMRFAYGAGMGGAWLRWRWRYERSLGSGEAGVRGRKLNNHTAAFYKVLYEWCLFQGVSEIAEGIFPALDLASGSDEALEGLMNMIQGVSMLGPAMVVLIMGRERMFNFLGLHFDRDVARLRRDGAFIAELLDGIPVQAGQIWWVHREQADERYPMDDPRRVWQQGLIIKVHEEGSLDFEVQLPPHDEGPPRRSRFSTHSKLSSQPDESKFAGGPVVRIPLPSKGGVKSKEDLLLQAQKGLRCVDYDRLTPELMFRVDSRSRPDLQAEWYGLSRPVRPGEKIDYFMSNSWYDDPVRKWERLKEVAERFQRRHGRSPTLWLDKLCIDQTSITDGLKVLPVNVMACQKLLCLCGDTYLSRLWCIWELFTLFAFVSEESALQRVEFVSLGSFEDGLDMLDSMAVFHVKDAHCYDPNEESRLRQIIDAVGTGRFNKRIAGLAQATRARLQQRSSSAGVMGRTISASSVGKSWSRGETSNSSGEGIFEDAMPNV